MFIALFGGGDAVCKHPLCFFDALLADQELAVNEIGGDVVGVAFEEGPKMLVGGRGIAVVHALQGKAVAGEGVVRFRGDKFFERLTAGFLLFGHWVVSYYTWAGEGVKIERETRVRMKRKNVGKDSREAQLQGKPVSASRSEMTEIVLPAQTNPLGKLLGGQVMHLVDMAAALAAHRHSNSYVVTASVDYIDFRNPVNLGEIDRKSVV